MVMNSNVNIFEDRSLPKFTQVENNVPTYQLGYVLRMINITRLQLPSVSEQKASHLRSVSSAPNQQIRKRKE